MAAIYRGQKYYPWEVLNSISIPATISNDLDRIYLANMARNVTEQLWDHTQYTLDGRFSNASFPFQKKSQQPPHVLQSLGPLDKLPIELLSKVLLELHVPALIAFRCVNRTTVAIVDALPGFRRVVETCVDVIRAIVATKATFFSFDTLYRRLSTRDCVKCGSFGGYLYLVTCERVCLSCFTDDDAYCPVTKSRARRMGMNKDALKSLPHVLSVPGTYPLTISDRRFGKRITLFDRDAVQQRVQTHKWAAITGWMREGIQTVKLLSRYPHRRDLREGIPEISRRYMAIVSAPHFGMGEDVDWGVHCLGCGSSRLPGLKKMKYSREAIGDHFRERGPVLITYTRWEHVDLEEYYEVPSA